MHPEPTTDEEGDAQRGSPGAMAAKDPVCGMDVDPDGPLRLSHQGTRYAFCSQHCLAAFKTNPDEYLDGGQDEPEEGQPGTVYTCPMHPEVRQDGPGSCPKCGMNPVFFGQTLAGARMPSLTYMLGFDDEAAQKAAWGKFIAHPEWKKLSRMAIYKDTVSHITNIILKPTPYSQV